MELFNEVWILMIKYLILMTVLDPFNTQNNNNAGFFLSLKKYKKERNFKKEKGFKNHQDGSRFTAGRYVC